MKELIARDSVLKKIDECFAQLNREIEEHCVMHDSVLARSKCMDAQILLNKRIRQIETVATTGELLDKEKMMEFCTGCGRYLPQIEVKRYKSIDGSHREVSSVQCVHADFCKYQHERFVNGF